MLSNRVWKQIATFMLAALIGGLLALALLLAF